MVAAAALHGGFPDVALRFFDDARHDGHRLARILAAGSFGGKHDGVSAVEDGISHVAGFGASGPGILDHGFQHLGGGDHRLAPHRGPPDDVLLDDGTFSGGISTPRSPRATMTPS